MIIEKIEKINTLEIKIIENIARKTLKEFKTGKTENLKWK